MRTKKINISDSEFSKKVKRFRDFKMAILTRTTKFSLDDKEDIETDCYDFPSSTGVRLSHFESAIVHRMCSV